jgi:predicted aspartyl protease
MGIHLKAVQIATLLAGAMVVSALSAVPPPAVAQVPAVTDGLLVAAEPTGPLYATPSRRDRAGRIVAPVEINGQGPFRFILDTGANRSAISAETVAALGLTTAAHALIGVHGVTGSAQLPFVEIASLRAGDFEFGGHRLPILPPEVFAGTDGILGIDALQDARVEVDFARDRVTIRRSSGRRAPYGYLVIPAERRHGGLLLVEGRVGRVPVKAILDTGAERSLGNEPLRAALALTSKRPREAVMTTVVGATPQVAEGASFVTPTITLGKAQLSNLVVTFADLHVFGVWSLDEEPALLIGMDLLGRMRHIVIDYSLGEFHLKPPATSQPTMRRCGGSECRSRIPGPEA